MSVITTGQGGSNYDIVAKGSVQNYCFNLTPLTVDGTFKVHVQLLIEIGSLTILSYNPEEKLRTTS
jgi:hypothetical protein